MTFQELIEKHYSGVTYSEKTMGILKDFYNEGRKSAKDDVIKAIETLKELIESNKGKK